MKVFTNRMYTKLCTDLSTANEKASEASLLVRQVSDRIETLEQQTRKLQTEQKQLGLEWEELYDKVRKAMARVSKRAERSEKADALTNGEEVPMMSAEQEAERFVDPISKRIKAMRRMGR